MKWLNIHIPCEVADEVGKTATRAGVCRAQAIAAALWIFSRLNTTERAAIIREYLYQRTEETNEPETVPMSTTNLESASEDFLPNPAQ